MISLQFDLPKLNRFSNIFLQIKSPSFRYSILSDMGDVAVNLIHEEFETGRDPYGMQWAHYKTELFTPRRKKFKPPISYRPGPRGIGGILNKTGRLKRSIRYKVLNNQVLTVFSSANYALFHQEGTRHMPQRIIFPVPVAGLPAKWIQSFSVVEKRALQKLIDLSQTR